MILFEPPRFNRRRFGAALYWKKLKSSNHWEVVEVNGVSVHIAEIVQTTQVVSRAQAGEFNKIVDQV